MDDLISRQDAINVADAVWSVTGDKNVAKVWDQIKDLPSAQPEIIRCGECEHWDTTWQNDYAPNYHYCPMIDGNRRNDFYCADAERRTDAADKC